MNSMKYRGYTARIEFDDRDDIFIGRVIGARDAICFHAETVADLRREFQVSVDDYLKYCSEKGLEPDKPASGKLMLRIPPEVHAAALVAAQASGLSLNQWAAQALFDASHAVS
jgi:predicted HicB family RNase H-like nuclease